MSGNEFGVIDVPEVGKQYIDLFSGRQFECLEVDTESRFPFRMRMLTHIGSNWYADHAWKEVTE